MRFLFFKILFLQTTFQLFSQYTVKGIITDVSSGEALIGSTLYLKTNGKVYVTNSYGFFNISLQSDSAKVSVSYVGYRQVELILKANDSIFNIKLEPIQTEIEGVVIRNNSSKATNHGQYTLSTIDFKNTPVLMAEKDVLKTIQMLPGVQQNREGTSNFSVRGGSHDQNLMLLDGIPVYNINHLFGFVSVFNTDVTNKVTFYKGGIPAHYGGRLSSVTDVVLREGNIDHFTGNVSIGILSTKVTLEGPIIKDKASFLFSGRRTIYDLLISPITYLTNDFMWGYYFQDYTLKINYKPTANNTIYISSYAGNDKNYFTEYDSMNDDKSEMNLGWSNITTALRWNNRSLAQIFSNVTLAYTQFKYLLSNESSVKSTNYANYKSYYSGIRDVIAHWDFTYYKFASHQINFGLEQTVHIFNPGIYERNTTYSNTEIFNSKKGNLSLGQEINLYAEDEFQYSKLKGNVGFRYSIFGIGNQSYTGFQPRINLQYKITENVSAFAGYNRIYQYLHLVSNSNLGMPTDLWLPISQKIPPQHSDQVSVGGKCYINNTFEFSSEIFYKKLTNVTDYKNGVIINNQSSNWDNLLTLGKGTSYGTEFMLEKKEGGVSGWLSYTLSKSERQFADVNFGKTFPFTYDRRHVINLFANWKINQNKALNINWVYSSGYWMSINYGNYLLNGNLVMDFSRKNNFQVSGYHHLDISYSSSNEKKRGIRSWILGIYNIYGHTNPFAIQYKYNNFNSSHEPAKLYEVGLFPIIPFVAWEYTFK